MSLEKIREALELLRIEATNNWLGQDGKSIVVASDFKDAEQGLLAVISELKKYMERLESKGQEELPTPVDLAKVLSWYFPEGQATAIAELVYQPLKAAIDIIKEQPNNP